MSKILICAAEHCVNTFEKKVHNQKYCCKKCSSYPNLCRLCGDLASTEHTSCNRCSQNDTHEIMVVCAAAHCQNMFKPRKKGRPQKYCCKWCSCHPYACADCRKPVHKTRCKSCSSKEIRNRPESKERQSKITKAMWQNPQYRKRLSEARKKMWREPAHRSKAVKRMSEVARTPENRERCSKQLKARWKEPGYRKKVVPKLAASTRELWKNPEHREQVSRKVRTTMKSPEYQEKMKSLWDDPEYRGKLSVAHKKMWRNPDYVERVLTAHGTRSTATRYIYFDAAKPLIHTRDNRVCQLCGKSSDGIDIHHIDLRTNNQHPYNLISLCDLCHDGIVHPGYRNGNKREMQGKLAEIATERSHAMHNGWWEEYNIVLERAAIALQLREEGTAS